MDEINESTTCTINVAFTDEHDAAITPSSATYALYDKFSGTIVIAETAIVSLDTSIEIVIPYTSNELLDQDTRYEVRTVYVKFVYDGRQGSSEYSYKITNFAKTPAS